MAAFSRDHYLYHNPTGLSPHGTSAPGTWAKLKPIFGGGGQLTSLADRLRRGLPMGDSSPEGDFNSGGANFVFTRVQRRKGAAHTGVFYRPDRMVRRLDAVAYGSDQYGNITDAVQRSSRAGSLDEIKAQGGSSNNQMIFKDGLSLFEDVDMIVLYNQGERDQAIADMKAMGYAAWPDGRTLEEVFRYKHQQ